MTLALRHGQLAYREALTAPVFAVAAGLAGIWALTCALIGPYGSARVLSVLERLPYCSLAHGLHLLVAYAAFVGTLYLMRLRGELQTVAAFAVEILIVSAPCAAITYAVYSLYADLHSQPPWHDFRRLIGSMYVATVPSLVIATALVYHVIRLRIGGSVAEPAKPGAPRPPVAFDGGAGADSRPAPAVEVVRPVLAPDAFNRRLPAEVGRDVIYLKAGGHYVHVVTTAGAAIVLVRLRDAIAELGDRGMQVHRSYWVAHSHVAAVERPDALRLTTGEIVPVSRPFRRFMRQFEK